jgi:hypothetical protein
MRQASSTFLTLLLAVAACGEDVSSDDTETSTTTLGDTGGTETSGESGDGECTPGTPYCECFESMCFDGLVCNDDNHCIPDDTPPMDATGGDDDECTPGTFECECGPLSECDDGLAYDWSTGECICIEAPAEDECVNHYDCPSGEICYSGEEYDWCGSLELTDWQVTIEGYDIGCVDAVGTCEYHFDERRWEFDLEEWADFDFSDIQNPYTYGWLMVRVLEDDILWDDYLNSFQVQIIDGVEAWKDGTAYVSQGTDGSDSMNLLFQPL